MKIIFMGTPEFAVPSLDKLLDSRHEIIAVVCQPDREKDRKGNLIFPPVKKRAQESGISVYQFNVIKNDAPNLLRELAPDIIVTAAYGQILSQEILDIPKHGVINVHASLLPKYRGSSPIQWAVINGENETGVTIMQTALGLDTGDIISLIKTKIGENETSRELSDRLSVLGAELLIDTLDEIESGRAVKEPQDGLSTKCSMIKKSDGLIDWTKKATDIKNFIHGMNPWPLAHSYLGGKRINIFKAEIYENNTKAAVNRDTKFCTDNDNTAICKDNNKEDNNKEDNNKADKFLNNILQKEYICGEVIAAEGLFLAAAGENTFLRIIEAQTEGKNRMDAGEMLKGFRIQGGERFTDER